MLTFCDRMAEILAGIDAEIHATEGITWKELLLPVNRYRVFLVISLQIGVQLTGNDEQNWKYQIYR